MTWPKFPDAANWWCMPPVDYQVGAPARYLTIDHPGDIHATLPNDVAAEFDHDLRLRQVRHDPGVDQLGKVRPDRGEVERGVLVEVRDAEATTEVDIPHRRGRLLGERED